MIVEDPPDLTPNLPSVAISAIGRTQTYYAELREFIRTCLVTGVDYGMFGNVKKKSLLQPGAQKLMHFAGLRARFPAEDMMRTEDWDSQPPFLHYMVRCALETLSGDFAGECYATCNSKENMYVRQSAYQIANTLVKMAQKRAFVGAIVSALGLSEEFTQDMEDMAEPAQQQYQGNARRPANETVAESVKQIEKPKGGMTWRDRFLAAASAMQFDWKGMEKEVRIKWLKRLTGQDIADTGPTDAQWEACAKAFECYLLATEGDTDKLAVSFVLAAVKQFNPEETTILIREQLSNDWWIYLAEHIKEIKS